MPVNVMKRESPSGDISRIEVLWGAFVSFRTEPRRRPLPKLLCRGDEVLKLNFEVPIGTGITAASYACPLTVSTDLHVQAAYFPDERHIFENGTAMKKLLKVQGDHMPIPHRR